jgi:hypothetical protein
MPKTLSITLSDAQYGALVELVDAQVPGPGVPAAATVEEYCAQMFARVVLRPALEQFPPANLKQLRKQREKAIKDYEEAAAPTVAASIV